MKFYGYINENTELFKEYEDSNIAKEFIYHNLTLKKPPKEMAYITKMLKKHLKNPLRSMGYRNGTKGEGRFNLAVYSESLDSMYINLTWIKKLKITGGSIKVNYNEQLEKNKDLLEKWKEFQERAVTPKDKKKARGAVNRLSVNISNLENKIRKGETPVPQVSTMYGKNKNDAIELAILHELGHRERSKHDLFKIQVFFNQGQFPTEYSKTNIREYFSEIYCLTKMDLIKKAPISDEAKEAFGKLIK